MSYPIISPYFNVGVLKSISVKITCPGKNNYGTGTLIKDKGVFYVLTAAHVIMNDKVPFDIQESQFPSALFAGSRRADHRICLPLS